jgi:hypothetical protein
MGILMSLILELKHMPGPTWLISLNNNGSPDVRLES